MCNAYSAYLLHVTWGHVRCSWGMGGRSACLSPRATRAQERLRRRVSSALPRRDAKPISSKRDRLCGPHRLQVLLLAALCGAALVASINASAGGGANAQHVYV